jgi:FixJ family two-component response regulator
LAGRPLELAEMETLLQAVRNALVGDAESRTARERDGAVRARFETLSPRERAVFTLATAGKANEQIAAALGIAERMVKAHRAQVAANAAWRGRPSSSRRIGFGAFGGEADLSPVGVLAVGE